MSDLKHEIVSIPVNCEKRTFEEQRRDLLTSLERRNNDNSVELYTDDWSERLSGWIDSSWENWNNEIRRLKQGMFVLFPLTTFGLVGTCDPVLLMDQLESQIKDIRNLICANDVPSTGLMKEYLKDAYEMGEDGKVHFNLRFDVKGFEPEDIKVTLTDNYIKVQAKKETKAKGSSSCREFCRLVELPKSVDHDQLTCNLTNDGVLRLEAPVSLPNYESLTFSQNGQIGIKPKSHDEIQKADNSKILIVKGTPGCSIIENENGGEHIHVEIQVDPIYKPQDLCINVDSNRLIVSGRHKTESNGNSPSYAEFTHSYKIPETLNPLSVFAQLIDNTLVLEAPLMKQHKVIQ
uniref:Major egg antigen (P40) n=1 Tax=Schistosoma japonicum TaxID=6182 RepID=C1LQR0_SCHJA|nr:Major egg antigen (p40) [Schistosoma japonicum]